MTNFIINKGGIGERSVKAYRYKEDGNYITFYDFDDGQVLSVDKRGVDSVEKAEK
ncbi:MAG: hypothetical protein JWO01_1190 [Microbacteriaceae bacterium]|nr:hypothetical protein [Microbacteriaceae bacterium]